MALDADTTIVGTLDRDAALTIDGVWIHGQLVPKAELADVLARKAKQQPLVPCKWRGIFRGGGE